MVFNSAACAADRTGIPAATHLATAPVYRTAFSMMPGSAEESKGSATAKHRKKILSTGIVVGRVRWPQPFLAHR
jgi:hypothetical protein